MNGIRVLATVAAAVVLAAVASACTPTRSYEENRYILDRIAREESKMLVEDVQRLLLIDEPTHLSRWRYP